MTNTLRTVWIGTSSKTYIQKNWETVNIIYKHNKSLRNNENTSSPLTAYTTENLFSVLGWRVDCQLWTTDAIVWITLWNISSHGQLVHHSLWCSLWYLMHSPKYMTMGSLDGCSLWYLLEHCTLPQSNLCALACVVEAPKPVRAMQPYCWGPHRAHEGPPWFYHNTLRNSVFKLTKTRVWKKPLVWFAIYCPGRGQPNQAECDVIKLSHCIMYGVGNMSVLQNYTLCLLCIPVFPCRLD